MRIGILKADSVRDEFQSEFGDYQGMFQRYGIIEGHDAVELVDIAAAFSYHNRQLPKGNRVGICTASGGGGGWLRRNEQQQNNTLADKSGDRTG